MRTTLLMAAAAAALSVSAAAAQDTDAPRTLSDAELVGFADAGRALAGEVCASCHAVEPGATAEGEVPSFQSIADTPGMTSRALTVWLTTFHPERTMPGIALTRDDREDVIAYILSLAGE